MERGDSRARAIWALLIAAVVVICGMSAARAEEGPGVAWPSLVAAPAEGVTPTVERGRAEGHLRATWWLADADATAVWSAWRARFAGWREIAAGDAGQRWATFEDAAGRRVRVWLSVGSTPGRVAAMAELLTQVAPASLPGRCVEIPQRRYVWTVDSSLIDQKGEFHRHRRDVAYATGQGADVDADGVPDVFVPVAEDGRWKAGCPEALRYEVYVVRGGCGHRVGRVEGVWADADAWRAPLGRAGLVELAMESRTTALSDPRGPRGGPRGGLPVMTTVTRTYRFDGVRYRQRDIERSSGVCHHCAYWTCEGPRATPSAP